VRLNGQPVTVVGVGPEDFNGSAGALITDFWLSISSTPVGGPFRVSNLERREDHWYYVAARLAPGVTVAQAQTAMDGVAERMGELYPELDRGRGITVFASGDVRFDPVGDATLVPAATAVMVLVGLVLLMACSNLANLLLVRGAARAPEMAVRQALGAGRARVARLFFLEGLLLAALGGSGGLLLARWAVGLTPLLPLGFPTGVTLDAGIDGRVVTFGVLLALTTGLVFGALPALRVGRSDVAGSLREDARTTSSGRRSALLRDGLVGVQVAGSLVLQSNAPAFQASPAAIS
jgi:hypothetical protein